MTQEITEIVSGSEAL
ncbi:MAG: hypothetical protein J6D20_03940 [Clostridia bacterium]|nr:hypothetical protein [Clostridia bacterium]